MPASDEVLIQRAHALAPVIRERSAEAARNRRLHDQTIQDLVDAELIQMFVPREWGGSEASLATMMAVVEPIAAACPSAGWISAFYISHNIYVAKFPRRTQEELFGPRGYTLLPAASAANLQASRVDGGWQVSGQAAWGSGIAHADWVLMSGMTSEGPRSFLMPIDAVEMIDNWHFAGMSATASNDYRATDVFVPDHHAITGAEFHGGVTDGSRLHANPLYSIPFLISAYCTILPVITGSLRGAMSAYEEAIGKRVRNFSGMVVKDQQHSHVTLGQFQIATKVASDLARLVYARAEQAMAAGPIDTATRLEAKAFTAYISNHCRDTANAMMASAGTLSFHEDQPLQRIWRDLNTVCSHAFWNLEVTMEQVGRHHFGLPLTNPLI